MIDTELLGTMIDMAQEAANAAYCPYSESPVGAVVLTEENDLFSGCNIENASFGLTICAERVALFKAVSAGQSRIRAIVVYADASSITPCGACLQVLAEFGDAELEVLTISADKKVHSNSVGDLLTNPFRTELKD